MTAIEASYLSKFFRNYRSRWSRIREWFFFTNELNHTDRWALRNIIFNLPKGSVTAFIGSNGAGKSTLLKILAGIMSPSSGSYRVSGSLSALLELGVGFDPDLTGRQNVYRTAQLLGLSQAQTFKLIPSIEEFAEIGNYLDQPVRTYSSGMQMRLAFSVATAYRPDIFLVDEALSVGDAYFQHKSLKRIEEFRQAGTTVLLVSHEKETVLSMCDHAVLLDHGEIVGYGRPQEILDLHNAKNAVQLQSQIAVKQLLLPNGQLQTTSGNGHARVGSIIFLDKDGKPINRPIELGEKVTLAIKVLVYQAILSLNVGFGIKNAQGEVVFGTNSYLMGQELTNLMPGMEKTFQYSFLMQITTGTYSISTALAGGHSHIESNYEWKDFAHHFEVVSTKPVHFTGQVFLDSTLGKD